jgi:hypothetical protein
VICNDDVAYFDSFIILNSYTIWVFDRSHIT